LAFDAVIGIGGIGGEPIAEGIAGKLNRIGVGAHAEQANGLRGPVVTFDRFILFEENGPELAKIAPALARRMYSPGAPRFVLNKVNETEQAEISRILKMARGTSPSTGSPRRQARRGRYGRTRCRPRHC
jgi:hypothetical protein